MSCCSNASTTSTAGGAGFIRGRVRAACGASGRASWEQQLVLPSGWMKRYPRLGMRPIARSIREWWSLQPAHLAARAGDVVPALSPPA